MRNLHLTFVVPVKSKAEISQNFVAFSEYMNFIFAIQRKKLDYKKITKTYLEDFGRFLYIFC